jgi:hypothetical protein
MRRSVSKRSALPLPSLERNILVESRSGRERLRVKISIPAIVRSDWFYRAGSEFNKRDPRSGIWLYRSVYRSSDYASLYVSRYLVRKCTCGKTWVIPTFDSGGESSSPLLLYRPIPRTLSPRSAPIRVLQELLQDQRLRI